MFDPGSSCSVIGSVAVVSRRPPSAMQLALAALTILALHGIEPPPNNRHSANQWAARLRADLTSQPYGPAPSSRARAREN